MFHKRSRDLPTPRGLQHEIKAITCVFTYFKQRNYYDFHTKELSTIALSAMQLWVKIVKKNGSAKSSFLKILPHGKGGVWQIIPSIYF